MKDTFQKTALVVEGGGMRGVFSAGVLNAFGTSGFDPFDLYIGVSAGACNLASHLARQNDRNFDIIKKYSSTSRFINYRRFFTGGHLMDLDWLWRMTISEYRLDLKTLFHGLRRQNKSYLVVATSMDTGKAIYLEPDETTLENYLKISSSIPLAYRNTLELNAEKVSDGGIADSIPVVEAYRRGAWEITVIRTRSAGYVKKKSKLTFLYAMLFRDFPNFVKTLEKRHAGYMEAVDFIKDPPAGVHINQIVPRDELSIGRATTDLDILTAAYRHGIECGHRFVSSWRLKISPDA